MPPRRNNLFRFYRRSVLVGGMAILASALAPAAALASGPVAEFIETLGEKAARMLAADDITHEEREKRFRRILRASFDTDRITRFALGKYARRVGENEMAEFAVLFEDLAVYSYARMFAAYSGHAFRVLRTTGGRGDRYQIVATEVRLSADAAPLRLDWQVLTKGTRHAVVDIRIEGISMAIAQREEFTSFLNNNNGDIAVFLAALRERVAALRERSRED